MASDFERFSRLVLDAVHDFRKDFDDFRAETSERFSGIEQRLANVEQRLTSVEERLTNIERELADIHRRLDKLDEDIADIRGYAKEIDDLRTRLSAIERHLGLDERIAA